MPRLAPSTDSGILARIVRAYSRRRFGVELDPGALVLHHRGVLRTTLLTEMTVARWRALDPTLQALATLATAAEIGCSWCLDFGYWEYHHRGVDPAKLGAVPSWREDGDLYTPLELAVLEYAAAMSATPPVVTDALVERLREDLTDAQVIELTALVSLENQRSRTNAALGLTSQGFRDTCAVAP